MKILIVDDHAVMRQGLRLILAQALQPVDFGEAEDSQRAIKVALQDAWDLVILDISLPGRSGLDLLKELQAQRPKLPVLVLSAHSEKQFAVRAFRSGAAGYLTKASAAVELVKAVQHILGGGRYVSAALAEQLASELGQPGSGMLHERLSDREFEILRLIASGKTVKEIAAGLGLSANTISTYRTRILLKMRLQTNAELTNYAFANRLMEAA